LISTATSKEQVKAHWEAETCGTRGIDAEDRRAFFAQIERERYAQEPFIRRFARFEEARGLRVLEIGVGAGTDFVQWARNGAIATGIDLTERAVELTRERLQLEGLEAGVLRADAENLPFADASFDLVYAYGSLHHSPDTQRAVDEVRRVLKPGGTARVMIYHLTSWTALMLWGVHCAAKGQPWRSPRWAIFNHLESPGTKAYTKAEARQLFAAFASCEIDTELGSGDLLLMRPSERYAKPLYKLAWQLYPRPIIRAVGKSFGLGLMIEAKR
jgi:SAM-dependent methyltransferase